MLHRAECIPGRTPLSRRTPRLYMGSRIDGNRRTTESVNVHVLFGWIVGNSSVIRQERAARDSGAAPRDPLSVESALP